MSNDINLHALEQAIKKLREDELRINEEIRRVEDDFQLSMRRISIFRDNKIRDLEYRRERNKKDQNEKQRELDRKNKQLQDEQKKKNNHV